MIVNDGESRLAMVDSVKYSYWIWSNAAVAFAGGPLLILANRS